MHNNNNYAIHTAWLQVELSENCLKYVAVINNKWETKYATVHSKNQT